ncbi:MAG: hypothetical protein ACYC3H_07280 [Bellilinea sp.]
MGVWAGISVLESGVGSIITDTCSSVLTLGPEVALQALMETITIRRSNIIALRGAADFDIFIIFLRSNKVDINIDEGGKFFVPHMPVSLALRCYLWYIQGHNGGTNAKRESLQLEWFSFV